MTMRFDNYLAEDLEAAVGPRLRTVEAHLEDVERGVVRVSEATMAVLGLEPGDVVMIEGERGSGLGRALIDFAIERARTRGARFLSLSTNENNAAGQRFYGRVGFVPMSEPLYGDGREINLVLRLG